MKSNIFNQIKVMKSNKHYRLGDLILCRGLRWKHDRKIILSQKEFKNSFLQDYLNLKNKNEFIDKRILIECVENHSKHIKLNDDTLYINIRLGDIVMDKYGKIYNKPEDGRFKPHFIFNVDKLIQRISYAAKEFGINNIVFVTALHFGDNEQNDTWRYSQEAYIENRRRMEILIDSVKKNLKLSISVIQQEQNKIKHIDKQFLTLVTAKYVIIDEGGFGEVIKLIRKLFDNGSDYRLK